MFNLVLLLAATISITLASTLFINWKTHFLSGLIESKVYSNANNLLELYEVYPHSSGDLLFYNYIERESLIMALYKITYAVCVKL